MKKHLPLFFFCFYLVPLTVLSQNLLNTTSWTVESGSASCFGQNGNTSENSRGLGKNHIGNTVVLWKATPDAANNADGGWNTCYYAINHNTTYRFSVWIKKTNSNSGTTHFGFNAYNNGAHHSLTLNGTIDVNPYFWHGDLPKLNHWYLLVGYVHKSSYGSTANLGRIYDGVTGKTVQRCIERAVGLLPDDTTIFSSLP